MQLEGRSVVVTGGASGLGLATALRLQRLGAKVCVADLNQPTDDVSALLGPAVVAIADVTSEDSMSAVFQTAANAHGQLRAVVHCAARGGDRFRIVDRAGEPGSLESFGEVVRVNLLGTYNVLRLAAAQMVNNEPVDGERGAIVMTASVAAFDGQIGQTAYAASKAGVHGITLVAARDLASRLVRVNTIAPGVFDTPMLGRLRPDVRSSIEATVPNPARLGRPDEFAQLATDILQNAYLNGETIRLDGAVRLAPR